MKSMQISFLGIAKVGWPFILGGLSAAFGVAAVAAHYRLTAVFYVAGLAVVFSGFCAYFFRDPERALPNDPAKIYATGDGTVLSVAREGPGDITTVRIFLSIFDVHVQRLPVSGTVEKIHYQKGVFHAAMKPAAKLNERNVVTMAVEGRAEKISFEQIAGFVARRIRWWISEGDVVVQGVRYGLIQFGSQAAIHLPGSARPIVKPGDKVAGGITPIAEWTAKD